MDDDFITYQLRMQLWDMTYKDWLTELSTLKFWGMVGFILLYYAIWWKLTDKRRISDLLLFGSFLAVMRLIIDLSGVTIGLWYYKVKILPLPPSIFLHDLTITPLTYMLVQQYSPNWQRYLVLNAASSALICFGFLPILSLLDIYQLMSWSHLNSFVVMYIAATLARGAFHLVKQVEHKATNDYDSPLQSSLMHPAFKPLDNKDKDR